MRRPRTKLQVSTFPFLAVLLCAMGSLLLLLFMMDRRAKIAAQHQVAALHAQRKKRTQEEETARTAEWEKAKERLRQALLAQQGQLDYESKGVHGMLDEASKKITIVIARQEDLKKAIKNETTKIGDIQLLIVGQQTGLSDAARNENTSKKELLEAAKELADLEIAFQALKVLKAQATPVYSLVPYRGKRGDDRKPIYVECLANGVLFHPEMKTLGGPEFTPAALRAEVERHAGALVPSKHVSAKDRPRELPEEKTGPYVLFLVRPTGIGSYYKASGALTGFQLDFGYELVDQDWVLDFNDPNAKPGQPIQVAWPKTPPKTPGGAFPAPPGLGSPFGGSPGVPSAPGVGSAPFGGSPGVPSAPGVGSAPFGGSPGAPPTPGVGSSPFGGSPGIPSTPGLGSPFGGSPGVGFSPLGSSPSLLPPSPNGGQIGSPSLGSGRPVGPGGASPTGVIPPYGSGQRPAFVPTSKGPPSPIASSEPGAVGGPPNGLPSTGSTNPGNYGSGQPKSGTPGGYGGQPNGGSPNSGGSGGQPNGGSPNSGGSGGQPNGGSPNSGGSGGQPNGGSSGGQPGGAGGQGVNPINTPIPGNSVGGQQPPTTDQGPGDGQGGGQKFGSTPLPFGPEPKRKPPTSAPARNIGERDFVVTVNCFADRVSVAPGGTVFRWTSTNSPATDQAFVTYVTNLIAKRQASVRPGEQPYRPVIRFQVNVGGSSMCYHTYPLLERLGLPMTRENVQD